MKDFVYSNNVGSSTSQTTIQPSYYAKIISFIRAHPLATVLLSALFFRLLAVLFSKGYLYSDDHFETINIVYGWLRHGALNTDGHLTWRTTPSSDIARFPLYTLFLYGIMKVYKFFGVTSLDTIMYGIRGAHALLSLLSVYAAYGIIKLATKSKDWALIGGLAAAIHFALPMLGVRTLIEVVGGHFWILSLYLIYKEQQHQKNSLLVWAGIVAGLGWMIRFQLVTAIFIVPVLLWWQSGQIRKGIWYTIGVALMVLTAGVVDYLLLGSFLASSFNHLRQGLTESPPYATNIFIYPAVIFTFFIPPLSLILFVLAGCKSFWSQHKVLVFSSLSFIVIHTLIASRQERYIYPIIPALLVIGILVIHWQITNKGYLYRHRRLFTALAGYTVAVNLILLPIATGTYGHKGTVEPLVRIANIKQPSQVMFVTPEQGRIFPMAYGGFDEIGRSYVERWEDLAALDTTDYYSITEFYICYPANSDDTATYIDSLVSRTGPLQLWLHVPPTFLDRILHGLNPRHNPRNESWVFRPVQK